MSWCFLTRIPLSVRSRGCREVLFIREAHYGYSKSDRCSVPGRPRAVRSCDVVTIVNSGVAIAALSPAQIAQLGANNVDALDADDNLLTLDTAQLDAWEP